MNLSHERTGTRSCGTRTAIQQCHLKEGAHCILGIKLVEGGPIKFLKCDNSPWDNKRDICSKQKSLQQPQEWEVEDFSCFINFSKGVPGEQRLADEASHAVRAALRGHNEE